MEPVRQAAEKEAAAAKSDRLTLCRQESGLISIPHSRTRARTELDQLVAVEAQISPDAIDGWYHKALKILFLLE